MSAGPSTDPIRVLTCIRLLSPGPMYPSPALPPSGRLLTHTRITPSGKIDRTNSGPNSPSIPPIMFHAMFGLVIAVNPPGNGSAVIRAEISPTSGALIVAMYSPRIGAAAVFGDDPSDSSRCGALHAPPSAAITTAKISETRCMMSKPRWRPASALHRCSVPGGECTAGQPVYRGHLRRAPQVTPARGFPGRDHPLRGPANHGSYTRTHIRGPDR